MGVFGLILGLALGFLSGEPVATEAALVFLVFLGVPFLSLWFSWSVQRRNIEILLTQKGADDRLCDLASELDALFLQEAHLLQETAQSRIELPGSEADLAHLKKKIARAKKRFWSLHGFVNYRGLDTHVSYKKYLTR